MPRTYRDVVVLTAQLILPDYDPTCKSLTSVKLTGTSFPTMFPTILALCLISISNSLASFFLSSTCTSISFLTATRSSAGSFACTNTLKMHHVKFASSHTFFFAAISFCTSFIFLRRALASKSTEIQDVNCSRGTADREQRVLFTQSVYIRMISSTSSTE